MAQHSPRFPACPECRYRPRSEDTGLFCLRCVDADCFDPIHPGESGEVVDFTAWAADTLAACAESRRPQAARAVPPGAKWTFDHRSLAEIEGTSEQELALSRAACTDGLHPRKGEVIYAPMPVLSPCDTEG